MAIGDDGGLVKDINPAVVRAPERCNGFEAFDRSDVELAAFIVARADDGAALLENSRLARRLGGNRHGVNGSLREQGEGKSEQH